MVGIDIVIRGIMSALSLLTRDMSILASLRTFCISAFIELICLFLFEASISDALSELLFISSSSDFALSSIVLSLPISFLSASSLRV